MKNEFGNIRTVLMKKRILDDNNNGGNPQISADKYAVVTKLSCGEEGGGDRKGG
jgi:hypothetical protein